MANTYAVPSAVPRRLATARRVGRAAPDDALDMSLVLGMRHEDELSDLIAEQQRAGSASYHHWLSPAEFVTRFSPPPAEYEHLAGWLERAGFSVHRWDNRLRIDFSGSIARVEKAFGVRMSYYRHRGRVHIANENPPALPGEFSEAVRFMRLNTFPVAQPGLRVSYLGSALDAMGPADMETAYNILPILQRGVDGSGQTIAVVARSDYQAGDVASFNHQFGAGQRAAVKVFPGANPGVGAPNGVCRNISNHELLLECILGEEGEVTLDVEWAGAVAPGATVLVDIAPTDIDVSLQDIVTHHPEAKIITISFGACERLDPADRILFGGMYTQAAAQGQTVLVATGDGGADGCGDGKVAAVNVLSVDPNVTAVGGTALDPGFDVHGNATARVSESAWNDAAGASGGGRSTLVSKPVYQEVPGAPADGFRDVPDVSLLASPFQVGYVIVLQHAPFVVGGTSAAAPTWAGIVALLNQASQVDGSGPLNARLYELARAQFKAGAAGSFYDVVMGDNSIDGVAGFDAGPGYDLVTGLGSPDVDALVQAFPTALCAGDCNKDGTVTVDEVLIGVGVALGTLPPAACGSLDTNHDGQVTVDELAEAISNALVGC